MYMHSDNNRNSYFLEYQMVTTFYSRLDITLYTEHFCFLRLCSVGTFNVDLIEQWSQYRICKNSCFNWKIK
jgi:hypothetical protein